MRPLKTYLPVFFLVVSAVLCLFLVRDSIVNQRLKRDYAELNHVYYGLFNVNEWKGRLSQIVSSELDDLYIAGEQGAKLKQVLEGQLRVLIDKIYQRIERENTKSAKGFFRQTILESLVDIREIKAGVPEYADAMVKELSRKENQDAIKSMFKQRLTDYFEQTYQEKETAEVRRILKETSSKNIEEAKAKLDRVIPVNEKRIFFQSMGIILLSVLVFSFMAVFNRTMKRRDLGVLLLTLAALLICGVTTPMIDIEAKISEFGFTLAGHQIRFENQFIYFQSKSILDVFWVMITHPDLEMKFVGLLLVTFSVFFPLIKILTSIAYFCDFRRLKKNKLVEFFALKSAKWSMADVFVVAIFMSYIGFDGIIDSQLSDLVESAPEAKFLTTNGTELQPGYYLFLCYTILGLFLPSLLTRPYECPVRSSDSASKSRRFEFLRIRKRARHLHGRPPEHKEVDSSDRR